MERLAVANMTRSACGTAEEPGVNCGLVLHRDVNAGGNIPVQH